MPLAPDEILVVSGLPRSGTSLVMRMLEAGGVPLLHDAERPADEHNPHGYFEFTPVRQLKRDASWVPRARGHAVKVISYLLPFLPIGENYRVVLVERALGEVAASQDRMLRKAPAPLDDGLGTLMQRQNEGALAWLDANHVPCLRLRFEALHRDPAAEAARLAVFAGCEHAVVAMAAAIDTRLYRNRMPD